MTAQPAAAIQVRGLRKSYGSQVVLDGIDLDVPEGTVFALLGPNGAGKTTAIHILSTLISADAGEIRVAGFDAVREPDAVRRLIGLTGQVSAVDGQFTGEENLRLMADLHHLGRERGRRRVAELLERFDLVDAAAKPAMTWSGGMRRRLDLAMTLVGEPRIIFLDEPTTGLDPRSRRVMWDIVRDLVARRRHDPADDAVPRGGGPARDRDRAARRRPHRRAGHPGRAEAARARGQRPARVRRPGGPRPRRAGARRAGRATTRGSRSSSRATAASGRCAALLDRLDAASIEVEGLSVRSADLDDVFLSLTGRRDGPEVPTP